jgi:hypothetical protein
MFHRLFSISIMQAMQAFPSTALGALHLCTITTTKKFFSCTIILHDATHNQRGVSPGRPNNPQKVSEYPGPCIFSEEGHSLRGCSFVSLFLLPMSFFLSFLMAFTQPAAKDIPSCRRGPEGRTHTVQFCSILNNLKHEHCTHSYPSPLTVTSPIPSSLPPLRPSSTTDQTTTAPLDVYTTPTPLGIPRARPPIPRCPPSPPDSR